MGKPGAKKLDQIISVTPGDIHIIMIPSPGGPVPTPIPHPVPNSLIKDSLADKVKVMGFPGAVKGSISQHVPPHIPMGPGPFQKPPKNKGKIITGSANVFYQGKEAAMLGDTAEMCVDPSDAPVGKVIGKAAMVLVGGGSSGGGGDGSGDGSGKKAGGAANAAVGDATGTGHPVDVATGNLMVSGDDLELDGPLPIQFVRTYISANAGTRGPLGYGWVHNFQESVELVFEGHADWQRIHEQLTEAGNPAADGKYVIYRDPNGLPNPYRFPRDGEELIDEFHRRRIKHEPDALSITNRYGIVSRFRRAIETGHVLQLVEVVDRNGNKNLFRYNSEGLLTEVEDCYGRTLIIVYDNQRISEIRLRISAQDPALRWYSYKYDAAGDLVEIIDRAGFSSGFAYADHLIVQDRNRDGYSFYFAYDERRRCIQTWGQDGYLTRYLSYDPEKGRTLEINGEGEQTIYCYNATGRVWRTEKGIDFHTETTFDAAGRPLAQIRGGIARFSFEYDEAGNIVAIVDAEGAAVAYEYNETGQVVSKTDPLGNVTAFEYDQRGNMARMTEPSGAVTRYEYDRRGRLVCETLPNRALVRTEYDRFGHPVNMAADDQLSTYQYDPLGNPLSVTSPGRPPVTYEWNEQGLLKRLSVGGRLATLLSYNKEGQITEWLEDSRYLHCYVFGRLGVVSEESHYAVCGESRVLESRIQYETDLEGRVTMATDQARRISRFTFDAAGRPVKETRFDGATIQKEYNTAGLVGKVQTNWGDVEYFEYDKRGLPTQVTYIDGSTDKFQYDECARLVSAANAWGAVEYEYDAAGRQTVRRQGQFELQAEIDPPRGTISWVWPEGIKAEYRPGRRGIVKSITFGGRRIALERDEIGRVVSRSYPSGLTESHEHDGESRITAQTLKNRGRILMERSIGYDDGRLSSIEEGRGGDLRPRRFRYDAHHRLAEVQGERPEFYRFDDRDNLIASHNFGEVRTSGDRLERAGDRVFVYDSRDRVSAMRQGDRVCKFDYDAKGQIKSVQLPDGGRVLYRYDALGRRVEKEFVGGERDGQRNRFLWDENHIAKEEHWQGDQLECERFYLFAGLAPLARIERSGGKDRAIFYHTDHTGRPEFCTDEKGNIVWQFAGDSFGAEAPGESAIQPLRAPGQYYDEETGLCYNRYRYYDPVTARFIQPDPVVRQVDVSRFSYPTDPVGAIDPLGLETMILVADPRDCVLAGQNRPGGNSTERLLRSAPSGTTTGSMFGKFEPDLRGVDHVIINAHGDPHGIDVRETTFGTKGSMDGKELAAYLKARGFEGSKVTIVACETGSSQGTFAQDVANGLGPNVTVSAPTEEVRVNRDGSLNVSTSGTRPDGSSFFRGGTMASFHSDTDPDVPR